MKRQRVGGVFIIFIIMFSQGITEEVNIENYLENIRKKIKEIISNRALQSRRNIRGEDRERKSRARKKIIEKLATPFVLQRQHMIIEYKKENLSDNVAQLKTDKSLHLDSTTTSLNNVSSKNPIKNTILSFKVPNFTDIFKSFESKKFSDKSNKKVKEQLIGKTTQEYAHDNIYFQAIRKWIDEYLRTPTYFWSTVQSILIDNEKGRKYFTEYVCKNLVLIYANPFFISPMGVKGYNGLIILDPLNTDDSGAYKVTGKNIQNYRRIAREAIGINSKLCSDFVVINSEGKVIRELFEKVEECINLDAKCDKLNIYYYLVNIVKKSIGYFKNMKFVVYKKLVPIYLELWKHESERIKNGYSPVSSSQLNILLALLYYDTNFRRGLQAIEGILSRAGENFYTTSLEVFEREYKCEYKDKYDTLFNKYMAIKQDVVSRIKSIERSMPFLYDRIRGVINEDKNVFNISSLLEILKTNSDAHPLVGEIIFSNSFQGLVNTLDNFINNLVANIKDKKDTLCSSIFLGYLYYHVKDIYPYPFLVANQSPIRPYIESAVFYMNQMVLPSYRHNLIKSLFGALEYLPILSYLFYTNYYAYMFSKCIIKNDNVDKELGEFIKANKCILKGEPIDCSNNPAMVLLTKFLGKNGVSSTISLKNVDKIIGDIMVPAYKDISMSDDFKEVCSSFESCIEVMSWQERLFSSLCSRSVELTEKRYTFCPDDFKKCKDAAPETLCFVEDTSGDICERGMSYCISPEKCQTETCRNFPISEMDTFLNNLVQKEQFCKRLKNEVYNCCNKFGREYLALVGKVVEVCKNGFYRVNGQDVINIYKSFDKFVRDSFGDGFLITIKGRINSQKEQPFEFDDCSKVFQ